MPRTIPFDLDEHAPHAVANGLKRTGIDATTTHEVGLTGASDAEHLAFALATSRVVFTQDDDFLSMVAEGSEHAGIAFCRHGGKSIGELIQALTLIWEVLDAGEMKNHVEFL